MVVSTNETNVRLSDADEGKLTVCCQLRHELWEGGIMQKENILKELTKTRVGSVASLAKEIGWSNSKTRRMISGKQEPTLGEMRELAIALGLETAEEIAAVFHL